MCFLFQNEGERVYVGEEVERKEKEEERKQMLNQINISFRAQLLTFEKPTLRKAEGRRKVSFPHTLYTHAPLRVATEVFFFLPNYSRSRSATRRCGGGSHNENTRFRKQSGVAFYYRRWGWGEEAEQ